MNYNKCNDSNENNEVAIKDVKERETDSEDTEVPILHLQDNRIGRVLTIPKIVPL